MDRSFDKMKVNSCCGCCSVQKGSLIIGIFGVINYFILLILTSILINKIENSTDPNFRNSLLSPLRTGLVAAICCVLLMLIIFALFIIGVVKRVPSYVFPTVCVGFANIVGAIGLSFGYITAAFSQLSGFIAFLVLVFVVLGLILQIYLWLVIFTFYKELVDEKYGHRSDSSGKIYQQSLGQA